MTSGGHIDLALVIAAGFVIIGITWEIFRRKVLAPRRDAFYQTVTRPRLSVAESRAWERRLANLHVIDDDGGSSVRIIHPRRRNTP